ncbi:MAG: hypothetical protein IKV39_03590 [Clostridia bacterium]|nr:hypothetical protein [Clostridia bacterium]
MGFVDEIKSKLDEIKQKKDERNSWQSRYARFKDSESNKKARKNYDKLIAQSYADSQLTEEEEAILFSQEYRRLELKNPAGTKFPEFSEYEVTKIEETYKVKGYCDSTNSYGAQVRDNYEYEFHKGDGEWACITDVGANALKTLLVWLLILSLPTIIACCSMAQY